MCKDIKICHLCNRRLKKTYVSYIYEPVKVCGFCKILWHNTPIYGKKIDYYEFVGVNYYGKYNGIRIFQDGSVYIAGNLVMKLDKITYYQEAILRLNKVIKNLEFI